MWRYAKILMMFAAAMFTTSCSYVRVYSPPTEKLPGADEQLYYWGKEVWYSNLYNDVSYKYNMARDPEALCVIMTTYQSLISEPGGVRQLPPPGICAELGFFLLKPGNYEIFQNYATEDQKNILTRTDFTQYAKELLEMEMKNYPESAKYLERVVKRLEEREGQP